ncbi:hypothetical protein GW915_05960 [bacterium]|nr:hypothetical protein [bacterium]
MRVVFLLGVLLGSSWMVSAQSDRYKSGANREEGWIVRKTKDGIVKIPKKQYFSFSGTDVKGQPYTPTQGVLGQRPSRRNVNLIPERRSYRVESLATAGFEGK